MKIPQSSLQFYVKSDHVEQHSVEHKSSSDGGGNLRVKILSQVPARKTKMIMVYSDVYLCNQACICIHYI